MTSGEHIRRDGVPFACSFLLVSILTGALGCSWRDDLDGERRVPEGATSAQTEKAPEPSVENPGQVAIDLFASRPLIAAHRRGALIIDTSTPDFVKYIDGGVRGDWLRGVAVPAGAGEGATVVASAVRGLAAELYVPLDADPGGVSVEDDSLRIRFRAKSAVKNQLVSIFLNEHKLTDLRMPTDDWQTYDVTARAGTFQTGENKLRFYFRSAGTFGEHASAAAFQRFAIGGNADDEPAFVVVNGEEGEGLEVTAPSRLSYYVQLPEAVSRLRLAFEGDAGGSVRIRKAGESKSRVLWEGGTGPVTADLSAYRGAIVRLDLISQGAAVWRMPQVVVDRSAESSTRASIPAADRIIVWSVSSLRSDRLRSQAGRGFEHFLQKAFVVPEVQATVPSAGGANASVMVGRFQTSGRIDKAATTVAEHLQKQGFATALISGNGFVSDASGYSQGFGYYDNPMRRQHHFGARTLWRSAKKFLLAHREERTFIHIATVEGHIPYRPAAEALERYWQLPAPFPSAKTLDLAAQLESGRRSPSESEKTYVRALYDAAIWESSAAFAAMLDEIEELHLRGNTVVILLGEHGEELWERGKFGHGASLFQESLLTPVAISGIGIEGLVAPKSGSSVDVAPTIFHLAGLDPDTSVQGQSFFRNASPLVPRPLFSGLADGSRALRLGDFKLMTTALGRPTLYDLGRDSGEQVDLSDQMPIAVRALRTTLAAFVAFEGDWSTARWGQPSAPKEAFARDLGY